MAHFVLEYSDNIPTEILQVQQLFATLHSTAADTGLFPLRGLRSRAHACQHYRIANGDPQHLFAHLNVLIGPGRTPEQQASAAQLFFQVFSQHFADCLQTHKMALSFELRELSTMRFNQNNLGDKGD